MFKNSVIIHPGFWVDYNKTLMLMKGVITLLGFFFWSVKPHSWAYYGVILANSQWSLFSIIGINCVEVHLVFDNYRSRSVNFIIIVGPQMLLCIPFLGLLTILLINTRFIEKIVHLKCIMREFVLCNCKVLF